jgi:hypothetical protein
MRTMPTFRVDVPMADSSLGELERAMRMLATAQVRMAAWSPETRTILAGISREDGRLVCLIKAASVDEARRMIGLALLPPGPIHEIGDPVGVVLLGGRHPGGDVHPGAETEFVEDVVDVGLDGPLGQE